MVKDSEYTFNSNGDYDRINNEMLVDVINNPLKYIKTIFGSWPVKTPYDIVDMGKYKLRLLLNQTYKVIAGEEFHRVYPDIKISQYSMLLTPEKFRRVYPDIIMEVTAHYSHNPIICHDNMDNGIRYYLSCQTCDNITGDIYKSKESVVNLLTVSNSEVSNLIKESSQEEAYRTLFNMALEKAEQMGYKLPNLHDDLFYQRTGEKSEECFTWKYYAFIETTPYVKSLIETLRKFRNENSMGEDHSYKEPPELRSAHDGYSEHKNSTFCGTFLLTPDLRFRNELENQRLKIIPYKLQKDQIPKKDEKFKLGKDDYDQSKKYRKDDE